MGLSQSAETIEEYKPFYGPLIEQMPLLIGEGRVPMNTAQLMQRRLEAKNGPEDVKKSWMNNYFDTGDAVVYHPNGDIKIVLDSQTLREMTPESQRIGGALILGEDVYNALQGEVFKKGKLGKTGDWMSREEVKDHPVWRFLARDQALLNDYTDFIFAECKERCGYDAAMGVHLCLYDGDNPEMRAWSVDRLVSIGGRNDLDYGYGRLVGISKSLVEMTKQI
jgi:hypothetical protein